MKVIDNCVANRKHFSDLAIGDTFKYCSDFYMKIEQRKIGKGKLNCVLLNGEKGHEFLLGSLDNSTVVEPVECQLVVVKYL